MLPHTFFQTHRGTNAPETNYQSGVSSYIYLGQWGANKHFSFLFCVFSILPSVSPFILPALFFASVSPFSSLSLCLPPPLPRYCWGKSFTGCVRCQIQWKTARDKGVRRKRYAALKSDRNKGVVLCQASFAQGKWPQQSCGSFCDVVANKKGAWSMTSSR